jgi:hypothetical protein
MLLKFIMRDTAGEPVAGTPTVTADGVGLTPTDEDDYWTVDAPLGSLVTATLTGAVTLDVLIPSVDGTSVNVGAVGGAPVTGVDDFKADVSAIDLTNVADKDDVAAILDAIAGLSSDEIVALIGYLVSRQRNIREVERVSQTERVETLYGDDGESVVEQMRYTEDGQKIRREIVE